MIFKETKLKGAFVIELDRINDERGFFARSFCKHEFAEYGLESDIVQCNVSYNFKKGTLRGMHYQIGPHQEAKIVTCIEGVIYDVIIDLRKDSDTYCQWFSVELRAKDYLMLYVPKGFAHGFQTLENNTLVYYQMTEFFNPQAAKGIRYNDSFFGFSWPLVEKIISQKDQSYADFEK